MRAVLFVWALSAGCGGSPIVVEPMPVVADSRDAEPAAAPDAGDFEPTSTPTPQRWTVRADGDSFDPGVLLIRRGDSVEWRNVPGWRTGIASGFLCREDGLFSGSLSFVHTFTQAGPFPYFSRNCCGVVGLIEVRP